MAKDKDPVAEAAERLERVRERRAAIERLPDSPSKQRMLQTNTTALMKAEAEVGTLQAGPTPSLLERAGLAASDWLDDKLMVSETFQAANQTGLPESEGNMGRTDRARHLLWTSKLAERYGKPMAAVITTFKEGENLFLDPFKKLSLIGSPKHTTASINEEQFEAIKETGRDFKTNMFALRNMPYDANGRPRAFTPEEARAIVENMVTTPTPLNERQVAPAPSGVLRNDREVTTTRYPEPVPAPSAPVHPEALPEGMRLSPGDSGQFPEYDIPVGAPDPKGDGSRSWIDPENRRRTMFRRDM